MRVSAIKSLVLAAILIAALSAGLAYCRSAPRTPRSWEEWAHSTLGFVKSSTLMCRSELARGRIELPHHPLTLFANNYLSPELLVAPGSALTAADAYPYDTPADVLGSMELGAFCDYISSLDDSDSEWHKLGDVYVSNHLWTMRDFDPSSPMLVVAFTTEHTSSPGRRAILRVSGQPTLVTDDSWVAEQNALRRSLDMQPVPASRAP